MVGQQILNNSKENKDELYIILCIFQVKSLGVSLIIETNKSLVFEYVKREDPETNWRLD